MSGQRSERSRVTQKEGRGRRRPQLLHIWPPATAFPPPVRPCRVQEKLTTLNILRLSLPPRSRSAPAEASPHYTRLQPGSERGRKAHRSGGAGTRACALGLKDDVVAAGSSGRGRRLVIPKASLVSRGRSLRRPARPSLRRPPTRLFESFGLRHCRRRHGSRKPACVRACPSQCPSDGDVSTDSQPRPF